MALSLAVTITEQFPTCSGIYFEDTTGDYNADTNPGGYGGPNPEESAITSTNIYMTAPGTSTEILVKTDYLPTDGQVDITCSDYIEAVGDTPIEVDPTQDCCGDATSDPTLDCYTDDPHDTCFRFGCWTIRYDVLVDGEVVATTTIQQLFRCSILYDLVDLGQLIFQNKCDCTQVNDSDWQLELNIAWNDYNSLIVQTELQDCSCTCVNSGLQSLVNRLAQLRNNCLR